MILGIDVGSIRVSPGNARVDTDADLCYTGKYNQRSYADVEMDGKAGNTWA